jgi:glycosyltransferase involved in cell wall biosynthesis
VFIATYPPRECGIATFTQDLLSAFKKMFKDTADCVVAAINLSALDTYEYPPEVKWQINENNKTEYKRLALELNNNPDILTTIIEHEYGIFGGKEGENILSFITSYKKSLIVTLHTVLPEPSPEMRLVTEAILKRANKIVVLTQNSLKTVEALYPSAKGKIVVIPHGIHDTPFTSTIRPKQKLKLENKKVLTTFGLLSRGKGIEYVLEALPEVVKLFPDLIYLVLGETHPVVRRTEGESYRLELLALVSKLKLKKHVKFFDQYLDLPDLLTFLKATDIYISTSINPNQAVSGTLSYALGTGRAVISTDFVQAREMITQNIGRIVPAKNSKAIEQEIISLLSNQNKLKSMNRYAYEITRPMLWSNVALEFSKIILEISPLLYPEKTLPVINLTHLHYMSDSFGLFQFANFNRPNKKFGYTLDDNARALIVACSLYEKNSDDYTHSLATKYLNFVSMCQLADGTFTNYISHKKKEPTAQNKEEDIEESFSRALWAVCFVLNTPNLQPQIRDLAQNIFNKAIPHAYNLTHTRAKAITLKALFLIYNSETKNKKWMKALIIKHANSLCDSFKQSSSNSWSWFDNSLGYNNAVIPESLFAASIITKNEMYVETAQKSLEFLIKKTFTKKMYTPIGNATWHIQNETRSQFDQQPEDPTAMILALATAYNTTHNEEYKRLAKVCFSWFLGNNALKTPLYNSLNGGCFDGLHPDRVNLNQGAESLVSYLLARVEMEAIA